MYSLKRPHRAGHHLVERAPWVCIALLLAGCGASSGGATPASVRETGTPGIPLRRPQKPRILDRTSAVHIANLVARWIHVAGSA